MYKFWSIYDLTRGHWTQEGLGGWFCIPPSEEYLPENYPLHAIKKHEEEILPPPLYWLEAGYEGLVYSANHAK